MLFHWLKQRRRRKLLAEPFPRESSRYLERNVPFYKALTKEERKRLEGIARILTEEKNWEGCGGLTMDEEIKLNISAQAALLILNLDHHYYQSVDSVLVYPSAFLVPQKQHAGGILLEGTKPALGVAHHRGPVVLSWESARQGAYDPTDGHNVVFHEFAHKLDLLDWYADGTPPLESRERYDAWKEIMTEEYQALSDRARKGRATLLDKYGATDPAEFFAVATECFFERPKPLKEKHPKLYDLLRNYYGQDPTSRA